MNRRMAINLNASCILQESPQESKGWLNIHYSKSSQDDSKSSNFRVEDNQRS